MANYLLKLNETFYLYLILPKCIFKAFEELKFISFQRYIANEITTRSFLFTAKSYDVEKANDRKATENLAADICINGLYRRIHGRL